MCLLNAFVMMDFVKGGAGSIPLTEGQLVDLWEKMDGRVADLLQGTEPLPRSAIPFDAASDQPMEEQK